MKFKDIQATVIIDLSPDEEHLWKNIDKKERYSTKKAASFGLLFKESENLELFYPLYLKTLSRGGIKPASFDGLKSKNGRLFLVYCNNKVIGGVLIRVLKDKIILLNLASDEDYLNMQVSAFACWSLILWAKRNGFKEFDLGGYQLGAKPGDKLFNVNRFKEKWGGKIVTYEITSKNPFHILGRKLVRNFSLFRQLNDKIKGRR